MIEKQCKQCGKVLTAYSEEHWQYVFKQHCLSKHPEMINLKEDEDNGNTNTD